MAKELGRKLGKTLVADGWQDEVLGALWREELFWEGRHGNVELSNAPARRCSALLSSTWSQGCCYPFI